MAVLFTVLLVVVEVLILILVPPRNAANGLVAWLKNCSSDRLADDPIDATTAADTRTGIFTSVVIAVEPQLLPSHPNKVIPPF